MVTCHPSVTGEGMATLLDLHPLKSGLGNWGHSLQQDTDEERPPEKKSVFSKNCSCSIRQKRHKELRFEKRRLSSPGVSVTWCRTQKTEAKRKQGPLTSQLPSAISPLISIEIQPLVRDPSCQVLQQKKRHFCLFINYQYNACSLWEGWKRKQ